MMQYPQDAIDCLLTPLLTPSGIWADFNPIWMYWHSIQSLCTKGLIPLDQLPPEPDPSDYTNYDTPRSFFVPDNGFPI